VLLIRKTEREYLYIEFASGAPFIEVNVDTQNTQFLHLAQELVEGRSIEGFYGDINMHRYRITNLGDPVDARDAANKQYVDAGDARLDQRIDAEHAAWVAADDALDVRTTNLEQTYFNANTNSFQWWTVLDVDTDTVAPGMPFTKAKVRLNGVTQTAGYSYSITAGVVKFAEVIPAGTLVDMTIGIDTSVDTSAVASVMELLGAADGYKYVGQAANVAALRLISGAAGQHIQLREYSTGSGVGGGTLVGVSGSTPADDGVYFFRVNSNFGWRRVLRGPLTLGDAGAVGDAVISGTTVTGTDDTEAVRRAFNARVTIRENSSRNYRLTSSVTLVNGLVNFEGAGIGRTVFVYDHLNAGITFGSETNSTTKYPGRFGKCSCVRPNYLNGPSSSGPKSFSFGNFSPLVIEELGEANAIGYGIFCVFCIGVTLTKSYARDHLGSYDVPKSGSDGIHFYKCQNVWATYNTVDNVGDDALSSGSFDPLFPCYNINFLYNRINRVHGACKLYGYVDGATVEGNCYRTGHEGGVYLTNDNNSPVDSFVRNVNIVNNQFYGISGFSLTNVVAGGVLARFWTTNGNSAVIENITIRGNLFSACGAGIAAVHCDDVKRFRNLVIEDNIFEKAPLSLGGSRPYLLLQQVDEVAMVCRNTFRDAHSGAIRIDHIYGGYTASWVNAKLVIRDNIINNYGLAPSLGLMPNGILIRPSSYDLTVIMTGNIVMGQRVSDTLASTQGILVNTINPQSFIEANQSDNNIAIAAGSGAYKGTSKTIGAAPSVGTHYAGSQLTDVNGSTRYTCRLAGTFGTLTGITGSTTSGSKTVTLNDAGSVYVGSIITIAGVSGSKRVLSKSGNVIVIDTAAGATVTDAAVSFYTPTFITEAMS
ncbi:TPA: hypothetical protein ACF3LH_005304, partial [Klebsiella pneumoniae]